MTYQVMTLSHFGSGLWGWVSLAAFDSKEEAELFVTAAKDAGRKAGYAIWAMPVEVIV